MDHRSKGLTTYLYSRVKGVNIEFFSSVHSQEE